MCGRRIQPGPHRPERSAAHLLRRLGFLHVARRWSNVHGPGLRRTELDPDQHALWIDPDDSNYLVSGNDGGVFFSHSAGKTWKFVENLPTAQFYDVSLDMRDPYHVCGGLQDNGSWCTPSATKDIKGISRGDAYLVGGGDGYFVQIHPTDPNIVYAEQGGANVARYNRATGDVQTVKPSSGERPAARNADPEAGESLRGNWDSPMLLSSHDPNVLYVGMNKLFRTTDQGRTWAAISPDLTLNMNRDTLQIWGGRVQANALSRHDGASSFSTLTAIGESPLDAKALYTGSDDGQLQVTRDGGATWKNVTRNILGLPPVSWVNWVEPSKSAVGRVYAAFDGHRSDDFHAHLYVSNDFGQTWTSITKGLPETPMNTIREHPRITICYSWARTRNERVDRRRRELDVAQYQLPQRSRHGAGDSSSRQRPCRRHLRSLLLDPRRPRRTRVAHARGRRIGGPRPCRQARSPLQLLLRRRLVPGGPLCRGEPGIRCGDLLLVVRPRRMSRFA